MSSTASVSVKKKTPKAKKGSGKSTKPAPEQLIETAVVTGAGTHHDLSSLKQTRRGQKTYAEVAARPKKIFINPNLPKTHSNQRALQSPRKGILTVYDRF